MTTDLVGHHRAQLASADLAALQSLLDASRATVASQALEIAAKDADLAELRACGLPSAGSVRRYRRADAALKREQARVPVNSLGGLSLGVAVVARGEAGQALIDEVMGNAKGGG